VLKKKKVSTHALLAYDSIFANVYVNFFDHQTLSTHILTKQRKKGLSPSNNKYIDGSQLHLWALGVWMERGGAKGQHVSLLPAFKC